MFCLLIRYLFNIPFITIVVVQCFCKPQLRPLHPFYTYINIIAIACPGVNLVKFSVVITKPLFFYYYKIRSPV